MIQNTRNIGKIFIFIVVIIITVVVVIALSLFLKTEYPCPNSIKKENETTVECHGYISIDFGDDGFKYVIYNNVELDTIVELKEWDDFKYVYGKIYAIGQAGGLPSEDYKLLPEQEYSYLYFSENKVKHISSRDFKDMPRYFIVDTKTRYVTPYVTLDAVPEKDRRIFEEIQN